MPKYSVALDQGTTSSRAMIFDHSGRSSRCRRRSTSRSIPKPGWVEHDPKEVWARCQEVLDEARREGRRVAATTSPRSASPTSARRGRVGPQHRRAGDATRSCGRTRAPTSSSTSCRPTAVRTASARRSGLPLATYFSGPKVRWILDNVDGARARGRGRRPAVRQHRHLVHLEPDRRHQRRPAHHRRHQRQPDDADGPRDAGLGRGDRVDDRRADVDAARDQAPRARSTARSRPATLHGHPDRGRPRRPAGGDVRPGLLRHRRGQEHVRHRQLHAAQHGHRGRAVEGRPADHGRATRSATSRRCTRSRARSPSPGRSCSGCATTSR